MMDDVSVWDSFGYLRENATREDLLSEKYRISEDVLNMPQRCTHTKTDICLKLQCLKQRLEEERGFLLAERTALARMISESPAESVIDRMSLEARAAKVENELAEFENQTEGEEG